MYLAVSNAKLERLAHCGAVAIDSCWRPLPLVFHLGEPFCDFSGGDGVGHSMAELVESCFEPLGKVPLVAVRLRVVDKSRLNKLSVPNTTVGRDRGNDALSDIEPTTVSYMTRETLSSSVRIDTFARVHGLEFPRNADQNVSPDPDRHLAADDDQEDYALENWKQDLRSAFKASKPDAVRQALDQLAAVSTFAPGKRVAEFGAFLLRNKGAWGKRAALSTVRLHARNITNLLCDLLEGRDPAMIPAADLSAFYFDILEEFTERPKRRLTVAHSLTQFHFFLLSKHEVDDIDYGELGLKDFAAGSANANIAVETEVARIRARIRENTSVPDDPRVVKAAEVLFLVALRSPARHQEVENIRLNDILYEDPTTGKIAVLFLRPWGSHTMKSGASVRRIDVKTQFRPDERNVIES